MTPLQQIQGWLEKAGIAEAELARRCGYDKSNFHRLLRAEAGLSLSAALRIYDQTALQLGPLDGLNKRDIEGVRKAAA